VITLVFEVYGAFCFFSLIAFLVLASVAQLRPDLDEDLVELEKLEKLKKLISGKQSSDAFQVDAPIIEDEPMSAPARPVKQTKRLIHRHPHLIHLRKPRIT
jgi:hypothetical protein